MQLKKLHYFILNHSVSLITSPLISIVVVPTVTLSQVSLLLIVHLFPTSADALLALKVTNAAIANVPNPIFNLFLVSIILIVYVKAEQHLVALLFLFL